jgi:F-type H+-transporting ATPase subunit alpha
MAESLQQYTDGLTSKIQSFESKFQVRNIGTVFEAGDGIAQVSGLTDVRSQELVQFENGVMGIAFNLEKNRVGVIILGEYSTIFEGMKVETTGRIASVPVGDELIGRVVNALGDPIDGKGEVKASKFQPLERIAPGVIERKDVDTPVQTGIKSIDAMIPIGGDSVN